MSIEETLLQKLNQTIKALEEFKGRFDKLEAIILELTDEKDLPVNWLIFHFSADYKSGDVKSNDEGEAIYLTPDEIKSSELFPSVKSIVDNILNPNDGTVFTTNSYHGFESGMKELSRNICNI